MKTLQEKNWIKATKLHIRQEKKQGNFAMHPAAATVIGAGLAQNFHTGLSGFQYGVAPGVGATALAAGVTYGLLKPHIDDIRKMKKHLDRVDKKKVNESLLTFKQFLTLEESVEFKKHPTFNSLDHETTIHGHSIHISVTQPASKAGHHEFSFTTNRDIQHTDSSDKISLGARAAIVKHVGHALSSYLGAHQPRVLKWSALNHDRHDEGFNKAVSMIGDKYGYTFKKADPMSTSFNTLTKERE
jgi:hypothetical protein